MAGAGLTLEVVSVCRRPPAWVSTVTADYGARLPAGLALRFRHVAPGADSLSVTARRRDEAMRIVRHVPSGAALVALDIGGAALSSADLARWLAQWRERERRVVLLIGGADGLDQALASRAAQRWSLSRLTLPHLLVQVVVAEQLYRAWTILSGHPYHRG